MRKQNRSSYRRGLLVLGTSLLFAAPTVACFVDPITAQPDPRLGREKRVIFSSGCTSSTTMAVGATDTITIQPAQEGGTLPSDLAPKSSDSTVIEVLNPASPTFDMHALKKGQSNIEVWSGGARYDWVTFYAEPAKAVKFASEPAVLAGGRTGIAITDIFGACGTDECPLFGHTFAKWSADPASSFTFIEDTKNVAHYTASAMPGTGALVATEPSQGGELLRYSVEIVDPAVVTSISGTLRPSANEEATPVPFPASAIVGEWFEVRVVGQRSGKTPVAISRHDIEWTVPTGLSLLPQTEPADPFVEVFAAGDMTGSFTLTAKVALLGGMEQSFVVNVVAQ